ncbi:MAG: hypothetical protein N0C84_00685 [Candidatus Thiodiazotropha taylori]|uniref:Uncharacterized protein n=1 Tax=Candidatus Thiodiazotropha taylori TaxID=2792791 RepID=A0A9E4N1J2_9GAMM|nr:hypothetical protein [Candidatus Thiodiazotropha taylori]MCW4254961.1 hypothetical protein [Candidatus Thiodiazotropha taylori]
MITSVTSTNKSNRRVIIHMDSEILARILASVINAAGCQPKPATVVRKKQWRVEIPVR